MKVIVNICRIAVALTFIFSGFVKAIDPLGTQYKIEDYTEAVGLASSFGGNLLQWMALGLSVFLSAIEFCMGMFLLFAIHRRVVSKLAVAFMAVMTIVTMWLWIANPISDCGCFGDAIHLSNGQTLLKNLVLLACSLVVAWKPLYMMRFISKANQWIVLNYTVLFILALSIWSLYDRPIFDFRPYHIGANIIEGMTIPEGEKQPEFKTTFILEKDGVQKEFTLDNYPDSTWTFIDSKTKQVSEGYVPPVHDFSITRTDNGEDITEQVLNDKSYTFLLVSPHLENASDANFGEIDNIYEYATEQGYPFYCITASGEEAIERWKELTGAEYDFCTMDEITLKTIIRSNPGLVMLKNGTVIRKWSHNLLPKIEPEMMGTPLEKMELGALPKDSSAQKIAAIMLWFALPLFLLTLADRLWTWTKWLKKEKKGEKMEKGNIRNTEKMKQDS